MKKPVLFLVNFLFLINTVNAQEQVFLDGGVLDCPGEYRLKFQDEFLGEELDLAKWETRGNAPAPIDRLPADRCDFTGVGAFIDKNLEQNNGTLKIWTRKEDYLYEGIAGQNIPDIDCGEVVQQNCDFLTCDSFSIDLDFTTGGIFSSDPYGFQYGYFELRAKTPGAVGLWPAFWLWHHDEIDLFEFFGDPAQFSSNIHKSGFKGRSQSKQFKEKKFGVDFSEEFHIWGVEWTPYSLRFFLDGQLIREDFKYHTTKGKDTNFRCGSEVPPGLYQINPKFPSDLNRWFHIYITSGLYPKKPTDADFQESALEVDWVRVYQREETIEPPSSCRYALEGEKVICGLNEAYFYSLNAENTLQNVNWSVSSNLTIIKAAPEGIKVKINAIGSGWVKAEIPPQIGETCHQTAIKMMDINVEPQISFIPHYIGAINESTQEYPPHIGLPFSGYGIFWHWTVTQMCPGYAIEEYLSHTPGLYELSTTKQIMIRQSITNNCRPSGPYPQFIIPPEDASHYSRHYLKLASSLVSEDLEVTIWDREVQDPDYHINGEFKITDSFGNLIYSANHSSGIATIDVSSYPAGQYIIYFVSPKQTIFISETFIK